MRVSFSVVIIAALQLAFTSAEKSNNLRGPEQRQLYPATFGWPYENNRQINVCGTFTRATMTFSDCGAAPANKFCQSRGYVRASSWTTMEPQGGSTISTINGEIVERAADPNMQVFATIVCETE